MPVVPRLLAALALTGCGTPGRTPTVPDPTVTGDPAALCQLTVSCSGNILDTPMSPCAMTVVDGAGATEYAGPAGVELRGRSSLYFPKHQYSVELRSYTELPIWPGSQWRYLDDGEDAGTTWRNAGYDDSGWESGPAPLGAGESWLQTAVDVGPGADGRSVTTYFRAAFTLAHLDEVTKLGLGLSTTDGAAVYLNGVEIQRTNLASGADYATPSLGSVSAPAWIDAAADAGLLVDGTNVLAVEVHRAALDDAQLAFDLSLEATGDDQSTNLLDMGGDADWIVNGQYVDRSLFRNRLAYDLFQSFGGKDRYATETRFCELTLNDEYLGIYTLGEKLARDDDRIDIGKGQIPGDTFVIKLDDLGGFHVNAVGYGSWQMVYPDEDAASDAVVSAWLSGWEDAINGPDPADPDAGIFAWVDMDSAVDWVIVNELAKNHDAYLLSVYLWKDEGGKMFFAPWDFDLSMGYPFDDCGAEGWVARDYLDPVSGQVLPIRFVQAMEEVPAFRTALAARWAELRQGPLAEDAILGRVADYDAVLAPALDANFARWPIEDIAFSTIIPPVDNWLCPVTSYADEHQRTLDFLSARLAWIDQNIDAF